MSAPRRRLLLAIIAMVLAVTTLAALLRPLREARGFHVPDAAEARAAQTMFGAALAGMRQARISPQPRNSPDAARFGLVAARVEAPDGLALVEPQDDCGGRGAYLLRQGADVSPVALVAPHRGADRHTGTIVQLLMAEHRFAAAAWNSAARRASAACAHAGDVAREATHYITAFSLAFAQQYPLGRVIQLHGFDGKNYQDNAAGRADMILSDGSRRPPEGLRLMAACLTRAFPDRPVRVYGIDSDILGATENRQGRALRRAGFAGFTHVEMSPGMRALLVGDGSARARFATCLEAGL